MNKLIINRLIVKLAEKEHKNNFWPSMIGGTVAGGIGTAITAPVSNVADKINSSGTRDAFGRVLTPPYNPTWKQALIDMVEEAKKGSTWKQGLAFKSIKNALQLGVALGVGSYVTKKIKDSYIKKHGHIVADLKIPMPSMKAKVERSPQRWTPINPEHRAAWAKLSPGQKKTLNTLFAEMSPRVEHHNKDKVVSQLVSGKTFKQISETIVKKVSQDPKVVL